MDDNNDNNNNQKKKKKTIGIAPMLDVTNLEFRQLMRILSKEVTLWTEMVVDGTVLHSNDLDNHLALEESNISHPIVCQLGGSNPITISQAVTKILTTDDEGYGYDEININMGCPSSLVAHKNKFGAVLMKDIESAKQVVQAMQSSIAAAAANNKKKKKNVKLSVKCRIGVDDDCDSIEHMTNFIQQLSPHVSIFYLHARKAVLGGKFTTKQNRAIPPLNYPRVYELCRRFPHIDFYINGGIPDLKAAKELCFGKTTTTKEEEEGHSVPCTICNFPNGSCVAPMVKPPPNLKGCLMGRTPRDNPCLMWDIDRYFYGKQSNPCQNRWQVLCQYLNYIETVIPKRCCDLDPRETRRLPTPFVIQSDYNYCPYCVDYGPSSMQINEPTTTTTTTTIAEGEDKTMTMPNDSSTCNSSSSSTTTIAPLNYAGTKPKITSHIYSRVLRPLIGILNGIPRAKTFRREFDRIVQEQQQQNNDEGAKESYYRNCGPAVVIRRSLRVIDRKHLLQDFIKTEDIITDYSRSIDCCRGSRNW